jgi:hypothetical protein
MWEWQLTDSEVANVRHGGDRVSVHFSAASARTLAAHAGSPPSVWGYALGVVLELDQTHVQHCDPHAMGRVAEGRLRTASQSLALLPLPGEALGEVALLLRFANGGILDVQARFWRCRFQGEPRWRESYAC